MNKMSGKGAIFNVAFITIARGVCRRSFVGVLCLRFTSSTVQLWRRVRETG